MQMNEVVLAQITLKVAVGNEVFEASAKAVAADPFGVANATATCLAELYPQLFPGQEIQVNMKREDHAEIRFQERESKLREHIEGILQAQKDRAAKVAACDAKNETASEAQAEAHSTLIPGAGAYEDKAKAADEAKE